MHIQDIQKQKIALGKAYMKSYGDLFSTYITKLNSQNQTEPKEIQADNFYNNQKKLENTYETEKYKLDIQEDPSIHTMISAVNYKQRLMMEDMNSRLKEAYTELKTKLNSGKYSFFERVELKAEYNELENNLKENLSNEIANFRSNYYNALVKRDTSKIDQLESSLLSNLLSKN